MDNLANTYTSQGKYTDAEVLYKQCLEKRKKLHGESHHETLSTMTNLAVVYYSQGKYRDAEVLFKQCLDKMKVVLGENHPTNLGTMSNLAGIYDRQVSIVMLRSYSNSA